MDDVALARAIHVAAVVLWIGGVGFVTMIVVPTVRRNRAAKDQFALFDAIEGRFSAAARWLVLIAGLSGLYLTYGYDAWDRFFTVWWMTAMSVLWLTFAVMLFVLEPMFLHRWLTDQAAKNPDRTMRVIQIAHWVLLTAAVATIAGAVAGSHGSVL